MFLKVKNTALLLYNCMEGFSIVPANLQLVSVDQFEIEYLQSFLELN